MSLLLQPKLLVRVLQKPPGCSRFLGRNLKSHEHSSRSRSFLKRDPPAKTGAPLDEYAPLEPRDLWKPLTFTVGFTCCAFGCASIVEYENARKRFKLRESVFKGFGQTKQKAFTWRNDVHRWWNDRRPVERCFYGIAFLNMCVFGMWHVPALRQLMSKYFVSHVRKRSVCLPMILSTFSHSNLIHVGLNMYVLYSFSRPIAGVMNAEQFTAFYLSAGVCSSFLSLMVRSLQRCNTSSIGASGAICGIIAATCLIYPQSSIGIVFLPGVSCTAENALYGLLLFDSLGVLLRWKFLDHAGHLGGTLFGIWYTKYGHEYLSDRKSRLLRKWHEFRKG